MDCISDSFQEHHKTQPTIARRAYKIDQTIENTGPGGVKPDLLSPSYQEGIFACVSIPKKKPIASKVMIQAISSVQLFLFNRVSPNFS